MFQIYLKLSSSGIRYHYWFCMEGGCPDPHGRTLTLPGPPLKYAETTICMYHKIWLKDAATMALFYVCLPSTFHYSRELGEYNSLEGGHQLAQNSHGYSQRDV